jgi:hypothetical protein
MTYHTGHIFPQQSEAEYVQKLWRPAELYHVNSKVTRPAWHAVQRAKHDPMQQAYAANMERQLQECAALIQWGAKRYAQSPHIALPPAPPSCQADIGTVLRQRCSVRRFSGDTLSLRHLSMLLFFSYGVTRYADPQQRSYPRRAVPSGGGIYPLEVYVLAFNVENLAPGPNRYRPRVGGLPSGRLCGRRGECTARYKRG